MLRLCLGIALLRLSIPSLLKLVDPIAFTQHLLAITGAILLLAGLWTPVIGALVALDEIWIAFSADPSAGDDTWIHMLVAMHAVSLAMLGPGAWSIDARLFGRQRIDIDRTRGRRSSL